MRRLVPTVSATIEPTRRRVVNPGPRHPRRQYVAADLGAAGIGRRHRRPRGPLDRLRTTGNAMFDPPSPDPSGNEPARGKR
jgi:hypothetical protein